MYTKLKYFAIKNSLRDFAFLSPIIFISLELSNLIPLRLMLSMRVGETFKSNISMLPASAAKHAVIYELFS